MFARKTLRYSNHYAGWIRVEKNKFNKKRLSTFSSAKSGEVFHVPSIWAENKAFNMLSCRAYEREDHDLSLRLMRESLSTLGYSSDNPTIVHDFAHHLLHDLLTSNGVPFVSKEDIIRSVPLVQFFGNYAPDFIVKSNPPKCPDPTILDLSIGVSKQAQLDKKKKYATFGILFHLEVLTVGNFCGPLIRILPQMDRLYMECQMATFQNEYKYWLKDLAPQYRPIKMFSEPVRSMEPPSVEFYKQKVTFKKNLEEACLHIISSKKDL